MSFRMTYIKLFFVLFFVMIITGCSEKVQRDLTESERLQENIMGGVQLEYENEVLSGNPYFVKERKCNYKGDFTFSDDSDTKDAKVECVFLGNSANGKLYQLKLDFVEGADIPNKLLNLGYFYVKEKKIFRILEISGKEKKNLLTRNIIPNDATLVCGEKEKRDKNKGKGIHEKITVKDDMIEYSYYDNSVATNFYETIVWKKDIGMILYRRGYAAELDSITLWSEKYVNAPHEFVLKGNK